MQHALIRPHSPHFSAAAEQRHGKQERVMTWSSTSLNGFLQSQHGGSDASSLLPMRGCPIFHSDTFVDCPSRPPVKTIRKLVRYDARAARAAP
jgi:hypothetical protein